MGSFSDLSKYTKDKKSDPQGQGEQQYLDQDQQAANSTILDDDEEAMMREDDSAM